MGSFRRPPLSAAVPAHHVTVNDLPLSPTWSSLNSMTWTQFLQGESHSLWRPPRGDDCMSLEWQQSVQKRTCSSRDIRPELKRSRMPLTVSHPAIPNLHEGR